MQKLIAVFLTLFIFAFLASCSADNIAEKDDAGDAPPNEIQENTHIRYVNRLDGGEYEYSFAEDVTLRPTDGTLTAEFTEHLISDVSVREYFNCLPQLNAATDNAKAFNAEITAFAENVQEFSTCVNVVDNTVNIMLCKETSDGEYERRVFAYNLAHDKAFDMEEFLSARGVFREDSPTPTLDTTEKGPPTERKGLCAFILNKNSAALYFPVGEKSLNDESAYVVIDFGPKNHELITDFDGIFKWVYSSGELDFNVQILNNPLGNYLNVTYGYPLLKDDSPEAQKINETVSQKSSLFTSSNLYKTADGKVFVLLRFETLTDFSRYGYAYDTVAHEVVDIEEYLLSRGVDLEAVEEELFRLESCRNGDDSNLEKTPEMIRLRFDGEPMIFVSAEDSAILYYEVYYKEKDSDRLVCYSEEYLIIFEE